MTLKQVITTLNGIAEREPCVNRVGLADIWELNHLPSVEYGAFVATPVRIGIDPSRGMAQYTLMVYYVDRLASDGRNKLDIQSTGQIALANILKGFAEETRASVPSFYARPFTQRFTDLCAGAYAEVTIGVPVTSCYTPLASVSRDDLFGGDAGTTLKRVVFALNAIAEAEPSVRHTNLADIAVLNEDPSIKYGAFVVTPLRIQTDIARGYAYYSLILYYADRLTTDEANRVDVQTAGEIVLNDVLNGFAEMAKCSLPSFAITPFSQKFKDLCAGAYTEVTIGLPLSSCFAEYGEFDEGIILASVDGYDFEDSFHRTLYVLPND